jgi:hypothetical protein
MASRLIEATARPDRAAEGAGPTRRGRPSERVAVVSALAVAGVLLLVLGRDQWFWYDEWDFFVNRQDTPWTNVFRPHNEHLTALPLASYRILLATVGMGSYLPYYGLFLIVHLTVVYLLYRLLRVSNVPASAALPLCAVIAFLGSGAQNVLWAWQTGLVGSLAFFLAALLVLVRRQDRRSDAVAVGLLVGSLLCSGVGVSAVAAAAATRGIQQRSLLAVARIAAVPAVLYVAWYLAAGRDTDTSTDGSLLASVALAPEFVFAMVSASAAGVVGLPVTAAGAVLAVTAVAGLIAAYLTADRLPVAATGGLLMLALLAGSTGLLRAAEHGVELAAAGRYVYLGATMLVLALAALAFPVTTTAERRRRTVHAVVAVAVVALGANVIVLGAAARGEAFLEQAVKDRFYATAALLAEDEVPYLPEARLQPELAPALTVAGVQRLLDRNAVQAPAVADVDPDELAAAVTVLQTSVAPADTASVADPVELEVIWLQDISLAQGESACSVLTAAGGAPQALLSYEDAGSFGVTSGTAQEIPVYQGSSPEFAVSAFREVPVGPATASRVDLAPPVGGTAFLRIDVTAGTSVQLCARTTA